MYLLSPIESTIEILTVPDLKGKTSLRLFFEADLYLIDIVIFVN